jgi:hypothetical protein
MNATTQTEERQCSKKKHISTFTAKGDGSFYKTCDECREKNRVYRESEKGKAKSKAYDESEHGKATHKAYNDSEQGKARGKSYNQSEKGKATRKSYRESEQGKAYSKAYRESEKGKAARTKQTECECGSTVQRNHWARHLKSKPHRRWLNARENFVSVLVELLATHKQDLVVDRAIDYDDRCHGCRRNNDFCRCGDFYAADYDCY